MRVACALVLLAAVRAGADPLFLNVLPAGQDGLVPACRGLPVDARPAGCTPTSPHLDDQLPLYRALPTSLATLTDEASLLGFFKPATIGPPVAPERVETPRAGVSIARDAFGVPHVSGATRADLLFGVGWATAEDRLFLADALRHIGRGRFSAFAADAFGLDETLAMDRTYYAVAGYSDDELRDQIAAGHAADPALGDQVLADLGAFVEGVNAYVAAARSDATLRPREYDLLGIPLEDWTTEDVAAATIAFLTVIGFGNGGGAEHENTRLIQALQERLGDARGLALWRDLREAEDPEAPTTAPGTFPYLEPRRRDVDPTAVATIDPRSFVPYAPIAADVPVVQPALPFPRKASNWLVVTGAVAVGGVPILVGGPQTGYFAPQALLELSLEGPELFARGAAVPGTPYVSLGHTPGYAFTATAGGSDGSDVFVERLCTPPGGAPNDGTVYDFACRPIYHRTDRWTAAGRQIVADVARTVHGPIVGYATVGGQPVALAVQRSSFGREVQDGAAFVQLNAGVATTPAAFRDVLARSSATLNWAYVNRTDAAYFHAGRYFARAQGTDPDLPTWGTGAFEWSAEPLPPTAQPWAVNPKAGFMTSWNNKPARGWRANDRNYAYGSIYRSLMLDVRLAAAVKRRPVTTVDVVAAMADAATVDLRGQVLLPEALPLVRGRDLAPAVKLLKDWARRGAHRRDADGDGRYDDAPAVALMDEWYPRLVHAAFDRQLGADGSRPALYDQIPLRLDDAPGPVGSAYQEGWYGYLHKTLRMARGRRVRGRFRVLRCADGTRRGCAAAVRASLADAVAALAARFGADPAAWTVDADAERIQFAVGGLATIGPIPWQNRPTFQQVVQVR